MPLFRAPQLCLPTVAGNACKRGRSCPKGWDSITAVGVLGRGPAGYRRSLCYSGPERTVPKRGRLAASEGFIPGGPRAAFPGERGHDSHASSTQSQRQVLFPELRTFDCSFVIYFFQKSIPKWTLILVGRSISVRCVMDFLYVVSLLCPIRLLKIFSSDPDGAIIQCIGIILDLNGESDPREFGTI